MAKLHCLAPCLLAFAANAISAAPQDPYDNTYTPEARAPSTPTPGFETSLHTGEFQYSVPIVVAPARNGTEPNLQLRYGSSSGNSWCGVGWELGLGYIERSTSKGAPVVWGSGGYHQSRYNDAAGFVYSDGGGTQSLVSLGGGMYRLKVSRTVVDLHYDGVSWELIDPSGTTTYFGETSNSRLVHPDFVSGSAAGSYTFRWSFARSVDRHGNQTSAEYVVDSNVPYLTRISYNANVDQGFAATHHVDFALEARNWAGEIERSIDFTGAFRREMTKRLANIQTSVGGQLVRRYELDYRRSTSTYRSLLDSITVIGNDGVSTASTEPLRFVYTESESSFDDVTEWGPFEYQLPSQEFEPWWSAVSAQAFSSGIVGLHDMNRDGLPDRVLKDYDGNGSNQYDRYYVQFNNGSGFDPDFRVFTFAVPGVSAVRRSGLSWTGEEVLGVDSGMNHITLQDLTNDGLPDRVQNPFYTVLAGIPAPVNRDHLYVEANNGFSGFASGTHFGPIDRTVETGGTLQANSPWNSIGFTEADLGDPNGSRGARVMFLDMNGDGRPDRLYRKWAGPWNSFRVQLNNGAGFDPVRFWQFGNQYQTTGWYWNNPLTYSSPSGPESSSTPLGMYDINGDGLPDRIMRKQGNWSQSTFTDLIVQFNTGIGFTSWEPWGPLEHPAGTTGAWGFPSNAELHQFQQFSTWSLRNTVLEDINGDGLVDRVMRAFQAPFDRFVVQLNNGSGFGPAMEWGNLDDLGTGGDVLSGYREPSATSTYNGGGISGNDTFADLVDIDGDGLIDRVMRRPGVADQRQGFLVQLNRGQRPDMLEKVQTSLGGSVSVQYTPSTQFDNYDHPDEDYQGVPWEDGAVGMLPFPIQTVTEVTVNDGFDNLATTRYEYSKGYYDFPAREFRGFGLVSEIDPHGAETRTFFHQGGGWAPYVNQGEFEDVGSVAKKGMPFRVDRIGTDGYVHHRAYYKVEERNIGGGAYFPFVALEYEAETAQYVGVGILLSRPRIAEHKYAVDDMTAPFHRGCGNLVETFQHGRVQSLNVVDYSYVENSLASLSDESKTVIEYEDILYAQGIYDRPDRRTVYEYDGYGSSQTVTKVEETTYEYNGGTGDVYRELRWLDDDGYGNLNTSEEVVHFFDDYGNHIIEYFANGAAMEYRFDDVYHAYLTDLVQNPAGAGNPGPELVTTQVVDARSGKTLSSINHLGVATTWDYDPHDRLEFKSTTSPGGSPIWLENYEYSFDGVTNGISQNRTIRSENRDYGADTDGEQTYLYLDGLGRVVQERTEAEAGEFRVHAQRYHPSGPVSFESQRYFQAGSNYQVMPGGTLGTSTGLDSIGRQATVTPPTGDGAQSPTGSHTTEYYELHPDGYPILGRRVYTDAEGKVTFHGLDAFGRVVLVEEEVGAQRIETHRRYDRLGRLIEIEDPDGNLTRFEYDSLGRLRFVHDPNAGTRETRYYPAGLIREQIDAKQQRMVANYDDLGRVTSELYYAAGSSQASETVIYEYDSSPSGSFLVLPGQLYKIESNEGWIKYSYDRFGRIAKERRQIAKTGKTYTYFYGHDAVGKLTTVTYPSAAGKTRNHYDRGGRLKSVAGVSGHFSGHDFYEASSFDADERPEEVVYGNSVTTIYPRYSNSRRLRRIKTDSGGQTLQNLVFEYDRVANLTGITELVYPSGTDGGRREIEYDDLHRLTRYKRNGTYFDLDYAPSGNVLLNTEYGTSAYEYTALQPHAVSSSNGRSFAYDDNGHMTSRGTAGGTQTLAYDERGLLTSVTTASGIETSFGYDHTGQRIWRGAGPVTTWIGEFVEIRGSNTYCHVMADGVRVATLSFPTGTVALVGVGGGTYSNAEAVYFHRDHLGSTNVVTDASGQLVQRHEYQPFGAETFVDDPSATPTLALFTGHELDPSTGLYYVNARYYDPELGRFIQPDNLLVPESYGSQGFNRYSYAENNPLRLVDPTGNAAESWWSRVKKYFSNRSSNYTELSSAETPEQFYRGAFGSPHRAESYVVNTFADGVEPAVAAGALLAEQAVAVPVETAKVLQYAPAGAVNNVAQNLTLGGYDGPFSTLGQLNSPYHSAAYLTGYWGAELAGAFVSGQLKVVRAGLKYFPPSSAFDFISDGNRILSYESWVIRQSSDDPNRKDFDMSIGGVGRRVLTGYYEWFTGDYSPRYSPDPQPQFVE